MKLISSIFTLLAAMVLPAAGFMFLLNFVNLKQ